jgi:hypothetical protein
MVLGGRFRPPASANRIILLWPLVLLHYAEPEQKRTQLNGVSESLVRPGLRRNTKSDRMNDNASYSGDTQVAEGPC